MGLPGTLPGFIATLSRTFLWKFICVSSGEGYTLSMVRLIVSLAGRKGRELIRKGTSMIYTVECSFADPAYEAEWNDFYSLSKLPALISVTGFHTSQRFKALSCGCPVYLAIHSIEGLDVLTGAEYREKGGGNFARWQQHIINWHRNLYDGVDHAPAVGEDELLALCESGPAPLIKMGLTPSAIYAVALEKFPERRWFATLKRQSAHLTAGLSNDVQLYASMTKQLTNARTVAVAQ